jgi:hypothetical protein
MYTDPIRFAKIKRFFEKRWHFIKTEIDYSQLPHSKE